MDKTIESKVAVGAIERATDALSQFLRDDDQRVLALKGAWGIGKSFFVRRFLEEKPERLPPFVAYASVFGLRSLAEVRDVVSGCIEPKNAATVSKVSRTVSKFLSSIRPSAFGFGFNIPDLSNAAFWHLAKKKGLLVILDDLERAHTQLNLEELLGFASSLTENSKAKVLLIFNEDGLTDDRATALARYREKAIDAELEYRPSTTELVKKFLPVPAVHDAVIQCLEASGGPNIRLILRIKRATRDLKEALAGFDLKVGDDDLRQSSRIVWLFHVAPIPITDETLKNCWMQNHTHRSDRDGSSTVAKEVSELAKAGGLDLTDLDSLIVEYLRCGFFPHEALDKFAQEVRTGRQKLEYQHRSRAAYVPFTSNFQATPEEAATPVERLLDDYADKIDLETLKRHCDFVAGFGRPTAKWWVQHVQAVAPNLTDYLLKEYLTVVTDSAAREILERRHADLTETFDAKATIHRIAKQQSWHEDDMAALNSLPADFYRDWFRSEDGDFLVMIRSFLRVCPATPPGGNGPAVREKIVQVLQGIACENPANEMRVHDLLKLPRLAQTPKDAAGQP